MRDAGEIERAVMAFARSTSNGGLIVTASALATRHRDLIITLAALHRLPAVYAYRDLVAAGGLNIPTVRSRSSSIDTQPVTSTAS